MVVNDAAPLPSLWMALLGAQVRIVAGRQWRHRVIEAGDGDALILVHGVGSCAELFAYNVMRLAHHFHVYAIDALYHGYSSLEPYDAANRVRRQADALLDFMDAERIPWAYMEGESMGAGMVFDVAMRHPERCGKIVITSGSYFVAMEQDFEPGPQADLLVPLCRESVVNFSRDTVRRRMEYLVASPDHLSEELVDLQYQLYSDPTIRESMSRVYGVSAPRPRLLHYSEAEAAKLSVPSLVLWTDRNRGQGPQVGAYLARCLRAEHRVIRNAAHWPQWEQPAEHDALVTDFLLG
jgi:2-hydroxy-6-oxonona-2,4-dienedioate hydrolase/2-hydroxy-6-oxo-6-(2'-carboxyphenyl)-hexa-2,4-dienoate hydrolase